MQEAEIVLASGSPRRQELMGLTGFQVRVAAAEVDETRLTDEDPVAMTQRLALAKANASGASKGLVLGADTVVVDGDQLLGKPKDIAEARRVLKSLRGRSHQVVTGIALIDMETGSQIVDSCTSRVPMRQFSGAELENVLVHGSLMDKAGSYAIQDKEFMPVEVDRMRDCYANVMGLPLCHVVRNLPHPAPADVAAACQAHTGYDCPIYREVLQGTP